MRAAGCVFAEEEADLLLSAAVPPVELQAMVARRVAGTPLEHLLGWVRFGGHRIGVEPGVFVPRRRTELLARRANELLARRANELLARRANELIATTGPRPVLVELCCGAGAVARYVCDRLPGVEMHAADIDPAAVHCARRNLAGHDAQVYQGDLFDPLPPPLRGRVDVLVVNPPYVPTAAIGTMPPEARDHEPRVALDGGPDGLDVLRRVVAQARDWLTAPGHLVLELGNDQLPAALDTAAEAGFAARPDQDDDLDSTVLVALWPG